MVPSTSDCQLVTLVFTNRINFKKMLFRLPGKLSIQDSFHKPPTHTHTPPPSPTLLAAYE